ncbi:7718_t:CDS:2, partial [Dentiscutata heterogama]
DKEFTSNKKQKYDLSHDTNNIIKPDLDISVKTSTSLNLNYKNINDSWILISIFKYQERFRLSGIAIESLIKIFKLVLTDVDRKRFENFLLRLIWPKRFKCTYAEFPNHPLQTKRQPCGFEVLIKIPVSDGYIWRPKMVYLLTCLKAQISTMYQRLGFEDLLCSFPNSHRQIEPELLRIILLNWRLDDLISAQSSNLKFLKCLSLIRPRAAVGSLAVYNNFEFDELRHFRQIYQLEIEDTITGSEYFPGKMLLPKKADFGLPDNVYNVLVAYYNNAYDMEFLSIKEATQKKVKISDLKIVVRPQ